MTEGKVQVGTSSFLVSQQLLSDNQPQLFHHLGRCTQTPLVRENRPAPRTPHTGRVLALTVNMGEGKRSWAERKQRERSPALEESPPP